MNYYLVVLASVFLTEQSQGNKFNVSYRELQFCKEYDVKSGYKYTDFFHIESLKRNRNSIDKDEESMVNVKLFVLATKDAHILLSPTEKIKSSPIYEIVLGAGGNTFNEIRRQRQSQPLKTMRMKNFLAPTDLMPLTLRISKAGNISVSITGQPPFISAMDPNVLDIKYISFSTWGTAEGKWFYDCEDDLSENKLVPIKQNPTDNQRLEDLLNDFDAKLAPIGLEFVMLDFDLVNTKYNARSSFMTSRGRFRMSWIDNRMVWNASLYNGKSQIHFKMDGPSRIIWTPQICLLNGKDKHFTSLPLTYTITVFSNGKIWAESSETTFSTWCLNSNQNWPYETVKCNIQIKEQFMSATLIPLYVTFYIVPRTTRHYSDDGEWSVIETNTESTLQPSSKDASYTMNETKFGNKLSVLKIEIFLRRNYFFYNQLISAPLVGSFLLILLSFWVERFQRVMLNSISLFILIAMLLILSDHAPNNYTPTIVVYYTCSLFVAWISLLSFTISCWFKQRKLKIELLPKILIPAWIWVMTYEEDSSNDLSKVIDRLLFFVCLMIFMICSAVGY